MQLRISKTKIISIIAVMIFILSWQFVSFINNDFSILFGSPGGVIMASKSILVSNEFWVSVINSFTIMILGFLCSSVVGLFLGIIFGYIKSLYDVFRPFLYVIDAIPAIVLLPVIIYITGIGNLSEFLVVFLITLPTIVINIIDAIKTTDRDLIAMAKSFGANNILIIKEIIIPSIIPAYFSSLRVVRSRAVIAIIVAEFFGIGHGLGYLINYYGSTFQINKMIFATSFVVLFNIILITIINFTEKLIKQIYFKKEIV